MAFAVGSPSDNRNPYRIATSIQPAERNPRSGPPSPKIHPCTTKAGITEDTKRRPRGAGGNKGKSQIVQATQTPKKTQSQKSRFIPSAILRSLRDNSDSVDHSPSPFHSSLAMRLGVGAPVNSVRKSLGVRACHYLRSVHVRDDFPGTLA